MVRTNTESHTDAGVPNREQVRGIRPSDWLSVARQHLGNTFPPDAVADAVEVYRGYRAMGIRTQDGSVNSYVTTALRAVLGQRASEQVVVSLVNVLERPSRMK